MYLKVLFNNMKISIETKKVVVLTLFCVALLVGRAVITQQIMGLFLVWNLFLAWLPLVFILITRRLFHKTNNVKLASLGIMLWLLFFPNAPYIITDLIHIAEISQRIIWFDSLGIFIVAITGLMVGLYSLSITHRLLRKLFSSQIAWLMVVFFSIISGFGVYLGRFVRLNSWDLFTNPFSLTKTIIHQFRNPLCWQMTFVFGVTILVFYWVIEEKGQRKSNLLTDEF